jgi:hypothetical protein
MKKNANINQYYVDQGMRDTLYGDRRIFSSYTPEGIKMIEHQFFHLIMNVNHKIKTVYAHERKMPKFIGKDGKEHDAYGKRIDVFTECEINGGGFIGKRVVWETPWGGERIVDFNFSDRPIFNEVTKKQDPEVLKKSIQKNPHLHKVIKKNLLDNLKRVLKDGHE